ncbi:hypothetical protein [Motilimonas sp. KMU-193]|uniref:hypothetical protein n=1 Tax=Motilimonas sp. KMU-193 TaxID=3388668 RepID=UPI00396B0FAA
MIKFAYLSNIHIRAMRAMLVPLLLAVFFVHMVSITSYAQTQQPASVVIKPGQGFSRIVLGDKKRDLMRLLGQPSEDTGKYISYHSQGLTFRLQGNRIQAIFFYFRYQGYSPFYGVTDQGIGINSTILDVINQYGEPDRVSETIVSQYGEKPGATEVYLSYQQLGIAFSFWDGELADIRLTNQGQ